MFLKQFVMIFISSVVLACAASPEATDEHRSSRGDCIHKPSIRGYTVLDERNLIVEAAGRRKYHIELMTRAHGLDRSWGLVFITGSSRVCENFSDVQFRGAFGEVERARIRTIRELTPEEHEHLLISFGKKEPEIKQTPAPQEVKGADVEELDPDDSD